VRQDLGRFQTGTGVLSTNTSQNRRVLPTQRNPFVNWVTAAQINFGILVGEPSQNNPQIKMYSGNKLARTMNGGRGEFSRC